MTRFDLILRGGSLLDGSGAEPMAADLGILGERIAAIGDLSQAEAATVLNVTGKFVAPGFIDIHTHSDLTVLFTPGMESSLYQGVTTEVVGNCGMSLGLARPDSEFSGEQRSLTRGGLMLDWESLGGFLQRVEDSGIAINIATLAGHGTLRKRAMGLATRKPTADEMTTMRRDLATAMAQGAIGLSSGLEYVPGMYADVTEMTELAKEAAAAGGFYATHLRDEGDLLVEAVQEALAVAEGAGIPLQLSHHKSERERNWGKIHQTLALVDAAQARGLDVLLDQYPYTAYQTSLATITLPPWAVGGTPETQAEKLKDPDFRSRTRIAMENTGLDYTAVQIATCVGHPEFQGRSLTSLAAEFRQEPRDFVLDLLAEGSGWISAVYFALAENDVRQILSDNRVMIGSDAVVSSPTGPMATDRIHPRTYGTFVRVLGHYVREEQLLTWSEAIRRMTSLPAQRIGLKDRGRLATGYVADITVFDPLTIGETATFSQPHALARGVEQVLVGGRFGLKNGAITSHRAGRVLRHSG